MNPLEALKELQVKPKNDKRQPVAVLVKGKEITQKPKPKAVKFQSVGEKPENENIEEGEEKEIEEFPVRTLANNPPPTLTIDFKEDKTFDRKTLLKKLADNKLTKTSIKPVVAAAKDVEMATVPITEAIPEQKKAKKVGTTKKIVIEKDDDDDNVELPGVEELVGEPALHVGVDVNEPIIEAEELAESPDVVKVKKPRAPRKPKQIEKGVAVIGQETSVIIGDTPIVQRLPKKEPLVNIKVSSYYMNNREMFINFINSLFYQYREELEANSESISCDTIGNKSGDFSLLTHQKIVRDYMNLYTPYRGLLLYHGLGSGKSCTSIAIAEGMKGSKKVIIMLPASLQRNYREELKKCGDLMFKKNQYWEWISITENPDALPVLSNVLGLPQEYIRRKKGAWFINVKKPANFAELAPVDQKSLDDQLEEMINNKYSFINYNGLRTKRLEELTNGFTRNLFDDCVVVIDEAHNLISRIVNKLKKEPIVEEDDKTGERKVPPKYLSTKLYEYLLSAKNARIILLTGTPVINYTNEFGILFNILRGYIKTWEIPLDVKTSSKIDKNTLQQMLLGEKSLDYLDYSSSLKVLTITRNPFGFKNKIKADAGYQGVSNTKKDETTGITVIDTEYRSDDNFLKKIIKLLSDNNIDILPTGVKIRNKKALPDSLEIFNNNYVDSITADLKNTDALKRRIIGLSSYFRSAQESLLPKYSNTLGLDYHVIRIPMSNFQFQKYEMARIEERQSEKRKREQSFTAGLFDDKEQSSTYRIFSRLFCNYVMPNRPMPRDFFLGKAKEGEAKEGEAKEGEAKEGEAKKTKKGKSKKIEEAKIAEEDIEEVVGEEKAQTGKKGESSISNLLREARRIEMNHDVNDNREGELEGEEILEELGGVSYKESIERVIKYISEHSTEFLTPEALETYSPKFLSILDNIQDPRHIGLHLIYSQFRTIEGIGIFSLVLEKNGFARFRIKKGPSGWLLDMKEEDEGKPLFALYTGTETSEEKEIIRNIYNGDWDYVDSGISSELKKISHNNNMGEIIKILMITSSGSEGINLRNTRYVHIMEPYWHPVRLEQVIGRARRICSHKNLPQALQTVEVFVYLMVLTPEQLKSDAAKELKRHDKSKIGEFYFTSDQYLYEISEIKGKLTSQLTQAIKESSFDCYIYNGDKCISFGEPGKNDYSYVPDYTSQQSDSTLIQNKELESWVGKVIMIRQKRYVYREITPTLLKIYDEKSYMAARENPAIPVVQVGTYEIKPNGEDVFRPLVN
jgi:hypothetical protein